MICYNDNCVYVVSFIFAIAAADGVVVVFQLLFSAIENQFLFESRARSSFI